MSTAQPGDRSMPGESTPGAKSSPSAFKVGCLVFVALVVLLFGGCAVLLVVGSNSDSPPDNSYAAQAACENSIQNRLKSPSTAKFNTQISGSDPYTVSGTVDSQNSFGATLRSSFQCTVTAGSTTVDYLE